MWIKKTPEEIRKLELYRLKVFLSYFAILFLIMFLGEKFIGDTHRFSAAPGNPLKWDEVLEKIPIYLITSLTFTIIGSVLDSNWKKKSKDKYLCVKCNRFKVREKNNICECGGTYVDSDYMKWIDNGDNSVSRNV